MTINSENNRNQYEGNGVTTLFPYNFKIYNENNIKVVFADTTGSETILLLDTDYTVSGVAEEGGGNISYPISGDPLTSDEILTVIRNTPFTQLTDLKNQSSFQANTLEEAYDHAIIVIQQLKEEVDRCLKIAISSESTAEIIDGTITEQVLACQTARDEAEAAADTAEGVLKYMPMNIKTDDFSLTTADKKFLNTMNSGTAKAFTMPSIVEGEVYCIKNIGAGVLTITPLGVQTVEVATLNQNETTILTGDATNSVWRNVIDYKQFATDSETITGTVTDKIVTPASLQAKVSSETAKGIIEIATQAETDAGTDDLKAVTPLKLNSSNNDIAIFSYQPGGTTTEGTFTSGAWRTRRLDNTIVNNITGCSLASNQITLPIGKYKIDATSITRGRTDYTSYQLQSISGTSTSIAGTVTYGADTTNVPNIINTYIELLAETVLELQNICSYTNANGFGNYGGYGPNVYSLISIQKIG